MSELKPCPFCGLYELSIDDYGDGSFKIVCESCGAGLRPLKTKEEAFSAWNDRPLETAASKALRNLITRLDEVHDDPAYQGVWYHWQNHFGPYSGPKYQDEFEAAKQVLNFLDDLFRLPKNRV